MIVNYKYLKKTYLFLMNKSFILSITSFIMVVYFFYREFKKNWVYFCNFQFNVNLNLLIISFFITFFAFLLDIFIWNICINRYIERKKVSFLNCMAMLSISNIFKYIPGLIWIYAAQILLFSKKEISKSRVLYVNFICFIDAVIVSILLGIMYVVHFFPDTDFLGEVILLAFLILDLIFILCNSTLTNFLIRVVNSYFNREIQILHTPKFLLIGVQIVYLIQWNLMGLGGYFLAQGIGLGISFADFYAILASMALSWVAGYLSVITPGGLGVRESVMYLILNHTANMQTSLLMPIALRLLNLLVELSLGFIGFLIALKFMIFSEH